MPVEQSVLTGFIPINSTAVKVYDGVVNMSVGWVTIYFDDNYYYDGSSNLMLVIDDNTGYYGANNPNAFSFVDDPSGNMVRIYNIWSTNYNPSSVSSYNGTIYHYRHRIKFGDVCDYFATCVSPYIYVDNITESSALLNIFPGNNESEWTVEYRSMDDSIWTTDNYVYSSPYWLGNLISNTNYLVRVKPNCSEGVPDHWATRSFRTACGDLLLPYSESFETSIVSENGSDFVSCWQRHSTNVGQTVTVATAISEAHGGEHYLNMPAVPGGATIAVLPAIYSVPLNTLEVEFYLSDPGNDTLEIGVMTDPDDASTFQSISVIHPYFTNSYEKIVSPLLSYSGYGRHIAFRRTGGATGNLKIDDLTVRAATGCYLPLNVEVTNIAAFSAEFNWTAPDNTPQWSLEYGVSGFTQGTGTVVTVNTLPFTLTGLLANHTYDCYVRSDCDTDSHSDWSNVYTFDTPCFEIDHFPYSENFSTPGTGNGIHNLPECWGRLSSEYVAVYNGTLGFTYDAGIAVLPPIADYDANGNPIDIRHLKLDLDAYYYDSSDHITVGVMSDPNDASTFQAVKEINIGYDYSSNYRHDEVFFYGYTGTGRHIAVKNRYASYAVADNFVISRLDYTCAAPDGLVCDSIGSSSAMVFWQSGPVGDAQEYTLQYKPQSDSLWITAASNLTESQFFLTGLTPWTWYDVRVRTLCTDNTHGEWATTTFQTECLSGGYAQIGDGTSTSIYIPTSYWHHHITRQLFYQSEIGSAGNLHSVSFQVDHPLTLQRTWKIFLQHTSLSEFSYTAVLDNLPPVQVFDGTVNFHDGWVTIYFDTPFYFNGTSNLVLTVQDYTGVNATTSNEFYVHTCMQTVTASSSTLPADHQFDYQWSFSQTRNNVIFQRDCDNSVTCGAPNLLVDSVGGNEAYLTWAAGYQETQWELEYKLASAPVWIAYTNPTGFHATLTGLQLSSLYEVRMRSVCGANNHSSWTYASFTTGCGIIEVIPYSEDFETNISGGFVDCWERLGQTATVSEGQGTTPDVTTNHCLTLTHNPSSTPYALAVLPILGNGINLTNLEVTLNLKSASADTQLEIGIMNAPDDTASFVTLGTLHPTSSWAEATVPLAAYTGNGKYVAFRMRATSTTASILVDDVVMDQHSSCAKPSNLTVTNFTDNSATLSWTVFSNSVGAWDIEYGLYGFTLGSGTALSVTDSTVTLTGLTASTPYTAYVRSNCGNEQSVWKSVTFTTSCGAITPPYTQDFENSAAFPDCWIEQFNSGTIEWLVVTPTSNPQNAHSGSKAICLKNASYTSYTTTLVTPFFKLQGLGNPTLYFWHTQKVWGNDQDTIAVLYRRAPNEEWVMLASYNQDIPDWRLDSLYLPNGTNTYQIAFQGTVRYGYGIYLDDISITADIPDTCGSVDGLAATDIGNHHITIGWSPASDSDHWTVCHRALGTAVWDSLPTTVPSVMLESLQGLTTYEIFVKSYCEEALPAFSDTIQVSTTNIGIPALEQAQDIQLFPNPTTGLLTITSAQSPIVRIDICNLVGKVVMNSEVAGTSVRMDISELPAGIYFLRIQTELGTVIKRVVKQ